jgi:predicted esterase
MRISLLPLNFPTLALVLLGLPDSTKAAPPDTEPLTAWFATAPADRGTPPVPDQDLSADEVKALTPELWKACQEGAKALGWDQTLPPLPPTLEEMKKNPPKEPLRPSVLKIGDFTMPYVMLVKGEKPAAGWPLFIALHGGGGNDKAAGPHAWDVNTREWQAQMSLFERVYEPAGIYFIPRMADDRKGRWYLDHNQSAFEEVIRDSLLFRDVDPNRVYLLGISEGGYGAIRFAGNRPDRFAATNGMAAAEPLDTSPPENMRNVGLRIDIGEKDTMFDRVGLARRMGEKLAELKKDDPDGYDFLVNVQADRGHGIDYAEGPKWIAERVRDPWPKRVVWTVRPFDKSVALQNYWLALPERPARMPLFLTAEIKDNTIAITAETESDDKQSRVPATEGTLLVRLNDNLVDLDKPVTLTVNGKALPATKPPRRLATMARTLVERHDPNHLFPAEISVPLGNP